jgi:ABC-2 type transport system permease protein
MSTTTTNPNAMQTNLQQTASNRTTNRRSIVAPELPPTAITTAATYAGRTLRQYIRTPQLIIVNSVTSIMFLLIFRYVFGGAINTNGVPYANFLIPSLAAASGLFAGGVVGVAEDAESGFFDRLRSLPVPRAAIMLGRSMADTVLITWGTVVTIVVGFAVGFRPKGGATELLLAFALCIVFAAAWSWLQIFLGLVAGTAQAAQGLSFSVFPLIFVSSAYVPVLSMPGWMQPIARHQPVTAMVDAVRALVIGGDTQALFGASQGALVLKAVAWSVAIAVIFAALSVRNFNRR